MKKTIVVLAALVLGVTMTAAYGKGGPSGLKGKYFLTSINSPDGKFLEAQQLIADGVEIDLLIEFLDGGKVQRNIEGDWDEGIFQLKGKKLTVTFDNKEIEGIVDGNKIILTQDNLKLTYQKK